MSKRDDVGDLLAVLVLVVAAGLVLWWALGGHAVAIALAVVVGVNLVAWAIVRLFI